MEVYGVVYLLIDGTNDKEYVGQTTRTVEERFKEHKFGNQYVDNAIRKHGADMFTTAILKVCYSREELDHWETHFIKSRNTLAPNGYNLTEGGEGGSPSEETIEKIRESALNFYDLHPERRDEISVEQKARFSDPEERAKAAERTRKSFEDPERVAKHSASQKKRFENPDERQKVADGVSRHFSKPGEREAQSVRISAYFDTPGAREKNGAAQKKRFEDPEERRKVAIGVLKFLAENGSRAQTDETKDKIRVKRLAYWARVRLEKVATENTEAAYWNVTAQELKTFHAENFYKIKPHSTDARKAQTEIKRAAKRLAAVTEQNRAAANWKRFPRCLENYRVTPAQ